MADAQTLPTEVNGVLLFSYGTLKQDFANYNLIQNLIRSNDASYLGTYITHHTYPLVIGPHGIPYLINLPSTSGGHRVKGELYSLSSKGFALLDEFEGVRIGHYERLPVQVTRLDSEGNENDAVSVEAEAYYAHRSFGEKMWEKRGRIGLVEYSDTNGKEYVRKENRPAGTSTLHDIALFLST
ncbi:putative gamma-glutamylcyclotransferase At3g02910 [Ricinus communis]|uniref:Gamma-glutamylcyclotransferase family protein n=1 Tax=Ricinus communis TaxID=3988 RepID=B9SNV5_RICCO|nr:putative gamma-glutamylcyclotransferase At3g02910 [Ricinus communis]EEF34745.1 conserved hypothetical protein [Ricinus communis]|eukprot:XP_002527674.1 putative gamma-glutamylcyclotransferase At3g02910 [Ricinus communis]